MNSTILQNGTEIASDLRGSSAQAEITAVAVKTTGELLAILKEGHPRTLAMAKTSCGLLGIFLGLPGDQIPLNTLETRRRGFREFLSGRRYTENSIRTYVNQVRVLLKTARRFGWNPDQAVSEEWKPLLLLAPKLRLRDIAEHFSRTTSSPALVSFEDVDRWGESRLQDGILYSYVASKKNRFWRLLQRTGWTSRVPQQQIRLTRYGVPLAQLAPDLRDEIQALLRWKQADFAIDRPKRGKIRAVSAQTLRLFICQLAGFVINICRTDPATFTNLVQKVHVQRFVEWAINERGIKGRSLRERLGMIAAVVKYHSSFASHDFTWLKQLVDNIPVEGDSERKKRKATRYLEYDVVETIPGRISADRQSARKKKRSNKVVARLAMEELMVKWLLVLAWRQRNLRECRIGGPQPNVFKEKIRPLSDLDKPAWVLEEEGRNPDAEFWQAHFTPAETKTGLEVHVLLPRQLIGPLEQYLEEYRPHLLNGGTCVNLFLSHAGSPMTRTEIGVVVGKWTLRYGGVRMNPHLIRDVVACKWLKEHPKDYLTLSKILWHKNFKTTIDTYGSRFNESTGVCAMEAWLDTRASHGSCERDATQAS